MSETIIFLVMMMRNFLLLDDASLDGSAQHPTKGDALIYKKPHKLSTTNTLSNIKTAPSGKSNSEWRTQRRVSPKVRMVYSGFFLQHTRGRLFADEKERKARTPIVVGGACSIDLPQTFFMDMPMMPKRFWAASLVLGFGWQMRTQRKC
ncbi:hypothetical protein Tco_1556081 [Tanacetum coccineum]